jgi:hypothetical protein
MGWRRHLPRKRLLRRQARSIRGSTLDAAIGEFILEQDFLEKSLWPMSVARRREVVAPDHEHLSIVRKCELL